MTVIKGHWSGDPCCNGLSTSNKPDLITSASVENFMKKSQKFIIYKKNYFVVTINGNRYMFYINSK
jgi:hypothetical protein